MLTSALQSSIGRKLLVGISGLLLLGFVIGHLAGNLLIFKGPDALNAYGQSLQDLGMLLWVIRFGLLGVFLTHMFVAICLARENQSARPVGYAKKNYVEASLPSRTMIISGMAIFLFVAYHLAHYTFLVVHFSGDHVDALGRHDIYKMVVLGFQDPLISGLYTAAIFFLCAHLSHAIPSLLQTFGFATWKPNVCRPWIGRLIAAAIFCGYISIPLSIQLGWVTLS